MRYLGIDYGSKRVGIAISDESGALAFPKGVFENTTRLVTQLAEMIKNEGVIVVVIGESKDYKGKPNLIMKKIVPFKKKLEEVTGVTTVFQSEVLTSQEASRIQGDNALNDASAAAIILQSYLDQLNDHDGSSDEDGEALDAEL